MFHILLSLIVVAMAQQQTDLTQLLQQCEDCSKARQTLFTNERIQKLQGPITLLVPNNKAMEAKNLQSVPAQQLEQMVRKLVLRGTISQLQEGQKINTLDGDSYTVTKEGDKMKIEGAQVIGEFRPAAGGRGFYVVDKIIEKPQQGGQQGGQQSGSATPTQASGSQQQGQQQGQQGGQQQGQQQGGDIFELIGKDPQVSEFFKLLKDNTELKNAIANVPVTMFLPNNQAMTQAKTKIDQIPKDKIIELLRYHIAFGYFPKLEDKLGLGSMSVGSDPLRVRQACPTSAATPVVRCDKFAVSRANVVGNFHPGSKNQGYYVIDKVLMPKALESEGGSQQGGSQQGGSQQGGSQQGGSQQGESQQGGSQ